jgi:hypothetical protein
MTLLAGFTGFGGVTLCADSQETVGDYSKRTVEKIKWVSLRGMSVAFAGAGVGHFVDLVSQQFEWGLAALQGDPISVRQVTAEVERVLNDYHEKHVWKRPDSSSAQVEFLLACVPVSGPGPGPLLFHTAETAVTWIQGGHKTVGVGCHLADFLFEHLHTGRGDKWHMFALGTYILNKVSDYVEGVGKGTNVIVFTHSGENFCPCMPTEIEQINTILSDWDKVTKQSFLGITDVARSGAVEYAGNNISLSETEDAIEQIKSLREKMVKLAEEEAALRAQVRAWSAQETAKG